MYPLAIQRLIDIFSKFPTVGPRTAARFVFYLQELPKEKIDELVKAIHELKEKIHPCAFCFTPFQQENKERLCPICSDPRRDKTALCVVERETDLEALEKTKKYKGLYFILGGTVAKLRKRDFAALRFKELQERVVHPENFGFAGSQFKEIIVATNATGEGEATALYLQRTLAPLKIKITRLARGLPLGGELEYADEETLSSALDNRR
ncbi:MAG: recombination protein RecR [Candidatus Wildermuthbacteria bacterium RIFCSPLOWO2_02_FULL_47_10]|nr:MAG: recombination protein RecR [Candidatus Wildermuthbacteria bacterium RIFCSPLOWO2_02_FULL_47_10]